MASRRRFATAAAAKLTGVWDPPNGDRPVETSAKAEIRNAFLSTGKVYAAQSFAGASGILDQYTRRWSQLYVEACEATHVRGEQSAEVLDLRMGCLHEGLEDLKALCRMFQQATAEVVENAVNAANALGGLDRCENIDLLRALVRPPDDAGTRAAVLRLRTQLAEVRALSRVGHVNEGLAAAVPLEQEIRKLNYEPLLVDTLMVVGVLNVDKGIADEAARAFEEALWTAVRCRHDEAAAEAATWLVGLIGGAPSDRGAGETWNRFAEAFLRRMGGHDLVWGWLFNNRAVMREGQGRLLEALEDARLSVAAKENALGPDHPDLGYSIGNMALYLVGLGQLAEAVEHGGRAVEIVQRGLGPNHPRTALLLSNYAECLAHVGRYEEAAEVAARALAVFERETDPDGRFVTYPLFALGLSHLGAGRTRQALPLLERANHLRSEKDPLPDKRAEARFALARALSDLKADPVRALSLAQQARDEYQKSPPTPATLREMAAIDGWLADVALMRQRA